jgi:hypothetical protein
MISPARVKSLHDLVLLPKESGDWVTDGEDSTEEGFAYGKCSRLNRWA